MTSPSSESATVEADDDGIRLDRWFKRNRPGVPHALLARWSRAGALRVDGARAEVSARLTAGAVLTIPLLDAAAAPARPRAARPLDPAAEAMARAMVIHRDASALVLDKPPGLATQGGTRTDAHVDGLLGALQDEARVRPKLVHRLDKDTSGALLIARTPQAAAFFAKAFANRSARKIYWAIVVGVPPIADGEIDLALAKQPGTGGEKMHVDPAGLAARTRYRVIDRAGNRAAFVELQPLTGRTHQLRVHMAAIGHPIVGDGKYGGKAAFLTGSISRKLHLHARSLKIDHPDGGKLAVTAPLPDHFAASLAALGFAEGAGDALAAAPPVPAAATGTSPAKTKAKAHAKQVRKAKRGERRARGTPGAPAAAAKSRPLKPRAPKAGPPKPGPAKPGSPRPGPTR